MVLFRDRIARGVYAFFVQAGIPHRKIGCTFNACIACMSTQMLCASTLNNTSFICPVSI